MALRQFKDSRGIDWTAWNVTPTKLHPITRTEDYLRGFEDGWLCFESADGKRRLADYPSHWEEMNDAALERLLRRADSSLIQRADETSGEFRRRQRVINGVERAERRNYALQPPAGHPKRRREDIA